jgi:hypothetical protein
MRHIYFCEVINEGKQPNMEYEKIYTGNISEQIEVYRKFETNLERRTELNNKTFPRDPCKIHCPRQSIVMG